MVTLARAISQVIAPQLAEILKDQTLKLVTTGIF